MTQIFWAADAGGTGGGEGKSKPRRRGSRGGRGRSKTAKPSAGSAAGDAAAPATPKPRSRSVKAGGRTRRKPAAGPTPSVAEGLPSAMPAPAPAPAPRSFPDDDLPWQPSGPANAPVESPPPVVAEAPRYSEAAPPAPAAEAPAPEESGPIGTQPEMGQPGVTPGAPRPGMRPPLVRPAPAGGRISFSKGNTRHQFRPSGFRPPRPFTPPGVTAPGEGAPGAQGAPENLHPQAENLPPENVAPPENIAPPMTDEYSDDPWAQRPAQPPASQPPAQAPRQGAPGQNRPQHPHHRGPKGREQSGQGGQGGGQGGGQRGGGQRGGGQRGGQQQHRRGPNQQGNQGGQGGQGGRQNPPQRAPQQQPHRGPDPRRQGQPMPQGLQGQPTPHGQRLVPAAPTIVGPRIVQQPPAPPMPPAAVGSPFSQIDETGALQPAADVETFPLTGQPQSMADSMTQGAPLQPPSPADSAALAPFAEDIEIEEPVPQVRRQPTGREMLINVVEGEEVRIAVIRRTGNGMLEELYMERSSTESHIGNIYKGRVTNVEPSIQAAFIDFGIGKNGFLHISDLHPQYFPKKHQPRMPQQHRRQQAPVVRRAPDGATAGTEGAPLTPADQAPTTEVRAENPPESPVMAHDTAVDAPAVQFDASGEMPPAQSENPAEQNAENGGNPGNNANGNANDSAGIEGGAPDGNATADPSVVDVVASVVPQSDSTGTTPAADVAADGAEDAAEDEDAEEAEGAVTGEGVQSDFGSAYRAEFAEDEEFMDEYESDELDDRHMKPMEKVGRKTPRRERPPIQQCLRRGQEVIVQVTKEGIGTKGPTLTSYISCPGRYLVMMPGMAQLGVSRKIEDLEQRRELKRTLQELNPPKNLGFIIRTAGTEVAKKELQGDLNYLVRMWKVIANRIRTHKAPVELYQESDLVIRTIRDVFNDQIDRIIVDNEEVASRVRDFLSIVDPRAAGFVELYTGTMPLFQKYGVEREIEKINSRRVEMANGGSLVIDSTEALVAIDVNSGRYREMRDAELTAFNMNREAVKEVVRQLRLRDLGGVIVIDFIDMREERHKREIERLLREEMEADRAKTKVLRMSQFCMIEMTRQRVRPSLKRSIYMDCPHCHGSALIKTPESVSLDAMRRLAAGATRLDVSRIDVRAYPSVATFLLNRKRKALVELEEKTGKRINITSDDTLAGDQIVLAPFDTRGIAMNLVL